MKAIPEDTEWNKNIKSYVENRDENMPPQGRFNAGQKQFWWIMFFSTFILLATGIVMWFPEKMPHGYHWVGQYGISALGYCADHHRCLYHPCLYERLDDSRQREGHGARHGFPGMGQDASIASGTRKLPVARARCLDIPGTAA